MPDLKALLEIADNSRWWPSVLRPIIADGNTEQGVWAAQLFNADGEETVRASLHAVVDRLAWERVQGGTGPLRRLDYHQFAAEGATRSELESTRSELESTRSELESTRSELERPDSHLKCTS